MALTIPFVIVFVTFIIVSGLLFTSLHRSLVRETAAPEEGNNNIWEQCLHILGRAGLAVVADSHIENGFRMVETPTQEKSARKPISAVSLPSPALRKWVVLIS